MTVREALSAGVKILRAASIPSAALDAEILLTAATKKSREFFYTYPSYKLSPSHLKKFKALIARRERGEPIAYLIKAKEFYGRNFYVDRRVLIPRPETETLIEEVIKFLQATSYHRLRRDPAFNNNLNNKERDKLPAINYYATDSSKQALAVARHNARRHKTKIIFRHGNLLAPIKTKKIDIVVANLPYIWKKWKNNTSADTVGLRFEPRQALFTKENGLYLYRLLFEQLARRQQKPLLIVCEFDSRQQRAIKRLAKKNLPTYKITCPNKSILTATINFTNASQ